MPKLLSRRTVLRGFGTAMALPLLDGMRPGAALAAGSVGTGAAPVRMGFLFIPNGVNVKEWFPEETGSRYKLSKTLAPLATVRDDVTVFSGLTHDKGRANGDGAGDHARSASVFLTGYQPVKTYGANIRVGVSVDQIAAQQVGHLTRFPSLELGVDGGGDSGNCDSGYSCAYSNNISWSSESTPKAKETDPRRVFDRLFGNDKKSEEIASQARRRQRRLSVLDLVGEDARRLERRLGGRDRRKIEEYFTSVREIEKRIEFAEKDRQRLIEEPDGLPGNPGSRLPFEQHLRLMSDLMVLAFQTRHDAHRDLHVRARRQQSQLPPSRRARGTPRHLPPPAKSREARQPAEDRRVPCASVRVPRRTFALDPRRKRHASRQLDDRLRKRAE